MFDFSERYLHKEDNITCKIRFCRAVPKQDLQPSRRSLMGCDVLYYGRSLPTFRRNVLYTFSELLFYSEEGGSISLCNVNSCDTTMRHISADSNLHVSTYSLSADYYVI
jgi:hypothetical protein